jgi:hypothetical protein
MSVISTSFLVALLDSYQHTKDISVKRSRVKLIPTCKLLPDAEHALLLALPAELFRLYVEKGDVRGCPHAFLYANTLNSAS